MSDYDAAEFEQRAINGDIMAAISVLSRASVKPEVLQALMTPTAHDEIRIALAARADVTPEQLQWVAQCDKPFILNRLVAHPKTPITTVMEIKDRAVEHDEDTWRLLGEYATRVLQRRDPAS